MRLAYASEVEVQAQSPEDLKGMVTVATHNATPLSASGGVGGHPAGVGAHRQGETKAEENLARIEKKLQNEELRVRPRRPWSMPSGRRLARPVR